MTASLSDILSGLFGLRHREHLNLIMGFTAGVLVGLISFDLLPEIFRLVYLICALPWSLVESSFHLGSALPAVTLLIGKHPHGTGAV